MTWLRKRTEEEKKEIQERMKRFEGAGFRERMDPDYEHLPAAPGEYRFVLEVDGQTYAGYASILKDHRLEWRGME
jgi:hypothetical protein